MNLNQVNLIGRVTRDPELKTLTSGTSVCSFSLATNRVWNDKNGSKQEDTTFHNMVSFGKPAETIAQYVVKGQLLFVTGRIQNRSWDDKETGKKVYRSEIMVENFQFGPKAGTSEGGTTRKPASKRSQADEDFDNINDEPAPKKGGKAKAKVARNTEEEDDGEINPDEIPF